MENVIFERKTYTPHPTDLIEVEDVVVVNGVVGWVDFIGLYVIAIVDETNTTHRINIMDIKSVLSLTKSNLSKIPLNWRVAQKDILKERQELNNTKDNN